MSKKWFHIHLSVDQDNSTVFIDGQQKQTFVSNIEIKQGTTVDLNITLGGKLDTSTVKPRFIAPRFTAKLAYRQEFLQSRFPYVVITPLKCQTRIPPSATVIEDQTVNLLLFKPRS